VTQVRVGIAVPTSTGTTRRPSGTVEFRPTKRRIETYGDAADVVLPSPFTVGIGADVPPVVELDPTEPGWAWQVVERVQGGSPRARYVQVPDNPVDVIDYADLVAVDPATLEPTEEPEAAWWATVNALTAGQGYIALDTDGVPYFDTDGVSQPVTIRPDTDGVLFYVA
jgi:hypothetical protein